MWVEEAGSLLWVTQVMTPWTLARPPTFFFLITITLVINMRFLNISRITPLNNSSKCNQLMK